MGSALCIAAAALGLDFASGRAIAFFYAQTGRASWPGAVFSGVLFGSLTAAISHLARHTGAYSAAGVLERLPGGRAAGLIVFLYRIVLAVAGCMLAVAAGHTGALALPLRHAAAWTMLFSLLLAAAACASGRGALRSLGALLAAGLFLYEVALLAFAGKPDASVLRYGLELRLRDNWTAAIVLALIHAAVGICLSAGATMRLTDGSTNPVRLGVFAGGAYMVLLLMGNAVLCGGRDEILALKLPFIALAGTWGSGGFFLSAAMVFLSATLSLSGILSAAAGEIRRRNLPGK